MKTQKFLKAYYPCKGLLLACLGTLVLGGCSAAAPTKAADPANTPSPAADIAAAASPSPDITAAASSSPDIAAATSSSPDIDASASSLSGEASPAAFKLYEGTYTDAYFFGDAAPTLGLAQYYTLTVTDVTDTSFDFRIHAVPVIRDTSDWYYGEPALFFEGGTAEFTDGETNAQFQGTDTTLYFTFPNSDSSGYNTAPDVAEIRISGMEEISDLHFVHLDIPGYELEAKGIGLSEGCARYLPANGSYTDSPDADSASIQIDVLSGDSFLFTVYDNNGRILYDEQIAVFEDLNSPAAVYRGESETLYFDCNIYGFISLLGPDGASFSYPGFADSTLFSAD